MSQPTASPREQAPAAGGCPNCSSDEVLIVSVALSVAGRRTTCRCDGCQHTWSSLEPWRESRVVVLR
ncbi:MAG: hypothetical protein AB7I13_01365 [Vicinamibacterales bacterium]